MQEELLSKIKSLPKSAGIYQFLDKNGKLLYIGKAKNLKSRVKSYFAFTPHLRPDDRLSPRINRMILQTTNLEYIVVDSENDALILENSLIKQLKPKYNILLRDDKTYPYIYIDLSLDFPRFEITRKVVRGKNIRYFGPFATGGRGILDAIYNIFALVQRKGSLKSKKKCLFYQINRCFAPCENLITPSKYREIVDSAIEMINNKQKIIKELEKKMINFAENENFEEAAALRDQIKNIQNSTIQSGVDLANSEFFDVLSIASSDHSAVAVRLFVREGKLISSVHQHFGFKEGYDKDEAYKRAFLAFYSKDMPITATKIFIKDDFLDQENIKDFLFDQFNKKFEIVVPKIGNKKQIVELAFKNAEEILTKRGKSLEVNSKLADLFELGFVPIRFEVFDNSHMMGDASVGAMVVYDTEGFDKQSYRHYNLESRDEYAQMREVLSRRAESFETNPPPDMWVIDGGETLRRLALDVLSSVGVDIAVVAISKEKLDSKAYRAKGAARDILYANGEIYRLDSSDTRLHFVQKLRDEAHRFAITFHRKQKQKEDMKIELLRKKGIGEATLRRLIDVFGTFENIENATFEEIKEATNSKIASTIKGSQV